MARCYLVDGAIKISELNGQCVASFQVVTNPLYLGWGMRFIPGGMLYNASGRYAVELRLHGRKKIRLGTDEPVALSRAIARATGLREPAILPQIIPFTRS